MLALRLAFSARPCLVASSAAAQTCVQTRGFAKAKKKGKKGGHGRPGPKSDDSGGRSNISPETVRMMLAYLDPEGQGVPEHKWKAPPMTEEQKAIKARYQAKFNTREGMWDADLARKLVLKNRAIEALPERLREQALIIDPTPPPQGLVNVPTWTPPVEGFEMPSERV
jgi:hypothetical protein